MHCINKIDVSTYLYERLYLSYMFMSCELQMCVYVCRNMYNIIVIISFSPDMYYRKNFCIREIVNKKKKNVNICLGREREDNLSMGYTGCVCVQCVYMYMPVGY